MTITEDNFLDMGNLLINEIFGSVALFIIVGLIVINYFGVKNNLPFQINLFSSFLWIGLVTAYVYNAFAWMVGLLIFGIIIYANFPKMFKR